MKVLGDRILIYPDPKPKKVTALILVPEILDKRKEANGTVVLLGTGKKIPPEIRVGSRVHTDVEFGSVDLAYQGKPCRLVSTKDVLAIFE